MPAMPAARLTDMHICPMVTGVVPHVGGPVSGPCAPTVLIGGLPAARITDMLVCVGPPDVIVKGSATVIVSGMPQARILVDTCAHGGVIVTGCFTVLVGDAGGGGSGGAGGGAGAGTGGGEGSSQATATIGASAAAASGTPTPPKPTGAKKIDDYNKKMWESAQKSALYFSGQQKSNNTCALMAVNSVLWEATGSNDPKPTNLFTMAGFPILEYFEIGIFGNLATDTPRNEREMVRIGIASLGYSRLGGTTNIAKVMNAVGIPATQIWDPTLTDIAKKVEDGHGVVVGYDTRPVWHDESNPDPEGHAVRVTGVERGANGEIAAFYINDSGIDKNGGAKRVSAANFKDALDGLGGGVMAVTDAPISTIDPVRL